MSNEKELPNGMKLVFAPGCFDDFDGTQEELDALVRQIQNMAESGELFEQSTAVEELSEEDQAMLEELMGELDDTDQITDKRTLQ